MTSEQYKATIRSWVEQAWNRGNLAVADHLYADHYVMHGGANDAPVRGPEGISGFVRAFRAGFPDMHFDIDHLVAEGAVVAWRFRSRGTHLGELLGIPPTGRAINVTGTVVTRFEGDLWAEDWVNYDQLGMLQQLGVIPVPEPASAGR